MQALDPYSQGFPSQSYPSRIPARGTVLVTGGAGFIGSHLCERLLDEGYRVLCLDNFCDSYDPGEKERNISVALRRSGFNLVRGDILDVELLGKLFCGRSKPDAVVHLAALAGVLPSLNKAAAYVRVDVEGTVNLLEMAVRHGVKQFIFASSSSVYGVRSEGPFREDDVAEGQVSPYAAAKRAGEIFCESYHRLWSLPVTVLRFFTVYGPRQRPDMAVRRFMERMTERLPVPLYGDGTSARDYTYIEDCVDGIIAAIRRPLGFEIVNLGSSRMVQLNELVDTIAGEMGVVPHSERQPSQPGDVPLTWADISTARRLLGWRPSVEIKEGVRRTVQWYREVAGRAR
ncbi:MAG: NAD-dependent epimerase/dehydratase family protein [Chloroflexota bacterium]